MKKVQKGIKMESSDTVLIHKQQKQKEKKKRTCVYYQKIISYAAVIVNIEVWFTVIMRVRM